MASLESCFENTGNNCIVGVVSVIKNANDIIIVIHVHVHVYVHVHVKSLSVYLLFLYCSALLLSVAALSN